MPSLVAVFLGVVTGWVSGGRVRGIANIRVTHPLVVGILFVAQAIARSRYFESGVGTWGLPIWALISTVFAISVARSGNRGLQLVGVGVLLNLLVVLANGGMPVDASAATLGALDSDFYHAASSATHLLWLGDVLRLPLLGGDLLLSAGDVLLLLGVEVAIIEAVLQPSDALDADEERAG